MEFKNALRLSAYYHGLGLAATVLGAGIALAGVALALGPGALEGVSLADPGTVMTVIAGMNVLPLVLGLLLGVFVHRVGRSAAFLHVQARAVEEGVDIPVEMLASHLNDRLRDGVHGNTESTSTGSAASPQSEGRPSET